MQAKPRSSQHLAPQMVVLGGRTPLTTRSDWCTCDPTLLRRQVLNPFSRMNAILPPKYGHLSKATARISTTCTGMKHHVSQSRSCNTMTYIKGASETYSSTNVELSSSNIPGGVVEGDDHHFVNGLCHITLHLPPMFGYNHIRRNSIQVRIYTWKLETTTTAATTCHRETFCEQFSLVRTPTTWMSPTSRHRVCHQTKRKREL